MKQRHHFTEEQDAYLARAVNKKVTWEEITRWFNNRYHASVNRYSLQTHAVKQLKLKRPETVVKYLKQQAINKCLEKRGGEEFNERQRQRAKHDPNWWGGKHSDGNSSMTKEMRSEIATRCFTPEVRARAHESRRETVRKERLRLRWGLEQKTSLRLQSSMSAEQRKCRQQMKADCGYIIFRDDPDIYYDVHTRRSERREARAKRAGCNIFELID